MALAVAGDGMKVRGGAERFMLDKRPERTIRHDDMLTEAARRRQPARRVGITKPTLAARKARRRRR